MYLQNNFTGKEHLFFLNYFLWVIPEKVLSNISSCTKKKDKLFIAIQDTTQIPTDLNLNAFSFSLKCFEQREKLLRISKP